MRQPIQWQHARLLWARHGKESACAAAAIASVLTIVAFASVAVPALAMFLPNWRALILIAICPIPLIILASFFGFVPESLSWLICEGKTELVRQTIEKVAQVNGKSLQVNINATFYHIHYNINTCYYLYYN